MRERGVEKRNTKRPRQTEIHTDRQRDREIDSEKGTQAEGYEGGRAKTYLKEYGERSAKREREKTHTHRAREANE